MREKDEGDGMEECQASASPSAKKINKDDIAGIAQSV
jgi:hypothetical protein